LWKAADIIYGGSPLANLQSWQKSTENKYYLSVWPYMSAGFPPSLSMPHICKHTQRDDPFSHITTATGWLPNCS